MSGTGVDATLETNPVQVKRLASEHFRTIAGVPPTAPPSLHDMPEHWQMDYLPLDDVNPMIYQDILSPPSDDEWKEVINSLPNGSAAGLSGIPYELLKNLPESASFYLRQLIINCFRSSSIPSQWKDATIYLIPKPYDWNCYLNNTQLITLLDTTRKIMTKIMNCQLGFILANNNVLKGNNYTSLSGSNCATPIAILESILQDAKSNNKPLSSSYKISVRHLIVLTLECFV